MPINKNAYYRYKTIDRLLSTGAYYTASEILEKLQDEDLVITKDQLNKDIRSLRDKGVPIESSRNHGGYHYSKKGYKLFPGELTKEEVAAIEFASEALNTYKSIELAQEAQSVLSGIYGRNQKGANKSGKQIIFRPDTQPVKGIEWFNDLYTAIDEEKTVIITYYKHLSDERKIHTVSPYILREYNGLWYVIAWCFSRELTLVFALDRILELRSAHVTWFKDPQFNPEQYFKYSFGITHSYYDKPERIKFLVRKDAYYYLQVKPLHSSQRTIEQTDEGFIVEIEVLPSSKELEIMLLGLGDRIKVLGPISLVNLMKKNISKALDQYNS